MTEESKFIDDDLSALEFEGVLAEVSEHAFSRPGKLEIMSSRPDIDLDTLVDNLELVTQFKEFVSIAGPIGFSGLVPLEGIFDSIENGSTILDSEEILIALDFLGISDSVKNRLDHVDERYSSIRELSENLVYVTDLRSKLNRMFDEHGAVRPTASRALMSLHERTGSMRSGIRRRLDKIIQDRDLSRIVQEDYVTMRNDRYVILLRPEFKGLLDGIVHDHSRSGASVYVEPFNVVELNNQIASLLDEEREEIRKIFIEATNYLRDHQDILIGNYKALAQVDALQAKALYALAVGGASPILVEAGFKIQGGRHPLLIAEGSEVVPMDVIQDPMTMVTVISGANMGGKTVALKIAGLFPLMTRCGILPPADEGLELQPFARIMADIGDDQDIRSKTSTFSGHMIRIKTIVETASAGNLVLLDELGGSTDPDEGAALAMAIIDSLVAKKVRVVVTTHLTQLKAYALSRPSVKNVSVEFHPVTLKPTFKLLYDLPGDSHAIATAERIGLPEQIIRAAKSFLDKSAGGSSRLIRNLKDKLNEVEEERIRVAHQREELERAGEQLVRDREHDINEFRKTARELIAKAQRDVMDLQQSIKNRREKFKAPPSNVTLDQIKNELKKKFGALDKADPGVVPGSRVYLNKFGKSAEVTEVLDGGRLSVSLGSLNVVVDVDDVEVISGAPRPKTPLKIQRTGVDMSPTSPQWEIRVIGKRVEEALPIVEKAIDNALLGGLKSIYIIHGKGTGRLKKGIWEYLGAHRLVKGFHSDESEVGGAGVTVVEMATD